MTWQEFIAWAKARGVKDEDEIGYIDFTLKPSSEPEFEEVDEGLGKRFVDIF